MPTKILELDAIPTVSQLYARQELKPTQETPSGTHTLQTPLRTSAFNDVISLIRYDITKLKITAIVNAANSSLLGGGGVDGAIHRAAGPELLKQCKRLDGCDTGDAKITTGAELPSDYVIHAVGPIYSLERRKRKGSEEELLASCYLRSLHLLERRSANAGRAMSLGFSGLSTGIYGYPKDDAAKVAIGTTISWLNELKTRVREDGKANGEIDRVIFVCFEKEDYDAYLHYLPQFCPENPGTTQVPVSESAMKEPHKTMPVSEEVKPSGSTNESSSLSTTTSMPVHPAKAERRADDRPAPRSAAAATKSSATTWSFSNIHNTSAAPEKESTSDMAVDATGTSNPSNVLTSSSDKPMDSSDNKAINTDKTYPEDDWEVVEKDGLKTALNGTESTTTPDPDAVMADKSEAEALNGVGSSTDAAADIIMEKTETAPSSSSVGKDNLEASQGVGSSTDAAADIIMDETSTASKNDVEALEGIGSSTDAAADIIMEKHAPASAVGTGGNDSASAAAPDGNEVEAFHGIGSSTDAAADIMMATRDQTATLPDVPSGAPKLPDESPTKKVKTMHE